MKKEFGYVTDREGNAVAGAEVYIRLQSDSTLATLYSDDGSTTTANPLTTDNDGEWSAYWADGVYKIQVFVEGVQQQEVNNHQHFDIDGFTAYGISLASAANAAAAKALLDLEPGTDVQAYDAGLAALAAFNTNGIICQTADNTFAGRTLTNGGLLTVTNGDGVSGNPTIAVDEASAAQYRANTADRVLTTDQVWAAADYVALNDSGGNIAVDLSSGFNFSMTMDGDYTLSAPSNGKAGQTGCIVFTQDGTGTQTLAYNAAWKFAGGVDPALSTTASAVDILFYQVLPNGTDVYATLVKAVA